MKIKFGLYDDDGAAVTGATLLKLKIKRDADDFFYDHDDSTFKASGWTTIAEAMAEPDSTNAAGEYELAVTITGWDSGTYSVYINYTGSPARNGSGELCIKDGLNQDEVLEFIMQMEQGRWKVINDQMIFYDTDDATALRTFDLLDENQIATSTNPVERTPA